jgi:hypothetical protein
MVSNQTAILNGGFAPEVSQWQLWVNRVVLTVLRSLPVCPIKRWAKTDQKLSWISPNAPCATFPVPPALTG